MSSTHDDGFQEIVSTEENGQAELEAGPRAERPNFLTATRFVDFDLPPEILEGLDKAGFEYCTPIQAQAIPVAMGGRDIAGQAQTGTGKTTAFLVPMLTRLLANKPMEPGVPRALIVTPTRELALQIYEDAQVLAEATGLRLALVIGGIEYKEQAELLASGPEIVICTPGRIIDYLQQGIFKTKGVEVAVVDEADRLLDMGFIKDLKLLLGKLPSFDRRQTMLFSATLDDRVMELTYQYMNPPQYITAEPDKATKINIEQELYHVGRDEKLSLLMGLIRREEHRRVIIFSNTKSGVEWLSKKLTLNGFQAEGITGDLPQPKRLKLMEAFKENRLQILVATDVASRGIHVDDVSHVYNYDLPQDAENYVHRIGRTARAGHTGKAVSFGCEDYVFHLEAIENLLGYKIPVFWADQEWFQNDEGGEVRVERRGSDRRKPSGGGRGRDSGGRDSGRSSGGGGRMSRGPAKSGRLGGIFGLSPRSTGDGPDERQKLTWTVAGLANPPVEEDVIVEAEIVEIPEGAIAIAADNETGTPTAEREGKSDRDRRRKRRRGRRGGSQQSEGQGAATGASASEAPAPEVAKTAEPSRPAEPSRYPTARVSQTPAVAEASAPAGEASETEKKSARKPRRSSAKKAAQDAPEAAVTEVAAVEKAAAPKAKAAPKTTRGAKKAAPADQAPAAAAKASAETPKAAQKPARTAKKAEEGAAAKKAAPKPAAKATAKPAAKPEAKAAPAAKAPAEPKAPRAKKAADEAAPEKAAKKPAAKAASKAAPAAKKKEADPAPKVEPAKKAAAPKTPRAAAKKAAVEAEVKAPKAAAAKAPAKKAPAKSAEPKKKAPKKAETE
ncbi:MAG: DEAD/DEAH box helicase [Candidatus Adiutrix sp.]|jgi:ATP-dependent RNA helicase RhlB|nr:DEAD/DEAH box helicase [Candidatus Adiutrix sp.]